MFDFPKDKEIVFVDIEANDKPKRILQFGAIKIKKNGDIDKKNWFCNPKCKITPHIYKIVSRNIKKIDKGMSHIRITEKIHKYLNNSVLISYGAFDYNFLNNMCKRIIKKKLNVTYIDLQEEWRKISMTKEVWALNKLANFLNVEVNEKELHDAYYDAFVLYQIFCEWQKRTEENIVKDIYKLNTKGLKRINTNQNKANKAALTINNIDSNKQGYCFIKPNFELSDYFETKKQILSGLDVLEVSNTEIKRNWSFKYDVKNKNFDYDNYQDELISCLKKYIISTRDKTIIISEADFHKLVRINNLCAEFINVFPLNSIMFTNGYMNLYSKINVDNEKFMDNLDLIKKWKVFLYIHNELE
ncbi:3'-5' exonuclease [Malacoplasma penetrans]|uniref:Probable DNA polymerase III n=1 Tax=Malacoplasma penetrans (strain HF-2) TaxID=272633 RepID=Q8EUH3_MALP2|nr:3'-5' exonuclease [Malacoplasma penetrans]RXY96077.1 3'-5' exonuclease [Malacoplasma penetrans]BAC44740.1 probable DNA polymerase III [Malacoplasma penetrans HF-2]